jgi:hypothetical protein
MGIYPRNKFRYFTCEISIFSHRNYFYITISELEVWWLRHNIEHINILQESCKIETLTEIESLQGLTNLYGILTKGFSWKGLPSCKCEILQIQLLKIMTRTSCWGTVECKLLNIYIKNCQMIVRYMTTCFGTTFETSTEIESLQGPTTLYGRLLLYSIANRIFWISK